MIAASALGAHAVHLVVFGAPVVVLVGLIAVQELRARVVRDPHRVAPVTRLDGRTPALVVASAGLVVSAAVHLAVTPEHFREYLPYGVFFLVLAVAQVVVARILLGAPRRGLAVQVAIASAAVVALWLVSRTTGLPLGAERWDPERVGVLDVAATTSELITAVACIVATSPRRARTGVWFAPRPGVVR